jgi:hypothetical protein
VASAIYHHLGCKPHYIGLHTIDVKGDSNVGAFAAYLQQNTRDQYLLKKLPKLVIPTNATPLTIMHLAQVIMSITSSLI